MAASAPSSAVDICNLALDHLAQEAITSIDSPTTPTETVCARWYHAVRRAVLRANVWNFASARVAISRDAASPAFGYADAYNLPNNFIRLSFIGNDSIMDYKRKYEVEGRQLLLNNSTATSLNIGYIYDITNVNKFDALFIDLLAIELAWRMSYKFAVKSTLRQAIKDLREDINLLARGIDGQERPPKRIERSKFKSARRGYASDVAGVTTEFA